MIALQNSGTSKETNPQDRREHIRKPLEKLSYLSLPDENGGIVLDVSAGGLSFHSIAPVKANGPIHFRFGIDSSKRVSAIGELAWLDAAGTTGGLRFTDLPDEVRKQIAIWAGESAENFEALKRANLNASSKSIAVDDPSAGPEMAAQSTSTGNPGNLFRPESASSRVHYNPVLYNFTPPLYSAPYYGLSMFPQELSSEAPTEKTQRSATASELSAETAVVVAEPGRTEAEPGDLLQAALSKHPIAAVGLTIALAFLVSLGIFAYVSSSPAGELFMDWGERVLGGSSLQTFPQAIRPPMSSEPDSSIIFRR
jgi:hypothetical protein